MSLMGNTVSIVVADDKMKGEWWHGKGFEEIIVVKLGYYSGICLKGLRKTTKMRYPVTWPRFELSTFRIKSTALPLQVPVQFENKGFQTKVSPSFQWKIKWESFGNQIRYKKCSKRVTMTWTLIIAQCGKLLQ
jgi:hypothetical protein